MPLQSKGNKNPPDIVIMVVNAFAVWQAEALIKAKRYTIFENNSLP